MSLARRVLQGDARAAARLISRLEDGDPTARSEMGVLYAQTGRAHIVGVTGPPGCGKSTVVDQLAAHLRRSGKKVGVLAVDPSSPWTGGALLGDRIRMQRHGVDAGVFIRSMASRGENGGLARAVPDAVHVLDAFGCDSVFVETMGVGQDEVEVVETADTVLVLAVPGLGDWVQSMKAGLLEAADVFVVNKADLEGAARVVEDLETLVRMNGEGPGSWSPPVIPVTAIRGEGMEQLLAAVAEHHRFLGASAQGERRRRRRVETHLQRLVAGEIAAGALAALQGTEKWKEALDRVARRRQDPHTAARALAEFLLSGRFFSL